MQGRFSEGVASHVGAESCAAHRDVLGEALTGGAQASPCVACDRVGAPSARPAWAGLRAMTERSPC